MKQAKLFGLTNSKYCIFCKIVRKEEPATIVYENEFLIAFLDTKPLFSGHCLLIPKAHIEDFNHLPSNSITPLFEFSQILSKAIENSLKANGTFIAINNKVSQSVPHLHIHVIPRKFKDGLKGFFWPRNQYQSTEEIKIIQNLIHKEIVSMLSHE